MLSLYLTVLEIPNLVLAALVIGIVLSFKYGRLFMRPELPASSKRIAAVLYTGCLCGLSGVVLLFS